MALSIFMHGSRRLPVLNSAISKLLTTQFIQNPQYALTPILAKNFSGFNRQIQVTKKNNIEISQQRNISHSAIWTAERLLSAGLLGIIPICIFLGSTPCDNILATAVTLHMHWGIESVVVDYIRPSLCGNVIPVIARLLVYVLSAFTLGGLISFNYNDIGISSAVKRLWAIKPARHSE